MNMCRRSFFRFFFVARARLFCSVLVAVLLFGRSPPPVLTPLFLLCTFRVAAFTPSFPLSFSVPHSLFVRPPRLPSFCWSITQSLNQSLIPLHFCFFLYIHSILHTPKPVFVSCFNLFCFFCLLLPAISLTHSIHQSVSHPHPIPYSLSFIRLFFVITFCMYSSLTRMFLSCLLGRLVVVSCCCYSHININ